MLFLVIKSKVHWGGDVALADVGDLLLTHLLLGANVVEDVVNDLEGKAEMLTHSETLYLKLWVLGIAQQRHSP